MTEIPSTDPQLPIPATHSHAQRPQPPSGQSETSNSSSSPQAPADALPPGIYCGPRGAIRPEDLTDGDNWQVQRFVRYLSDRKIVKDYYDKLIAAAEPGTSEYTRLADQSTTDLRQLAADYETEADTYTRELT
jgi:hypothetical protein